MTFRKIFLNHVIPEITADRRLQPVDVVVYTSLLYSRDKRAGAVARTTGIPIATVNRAIQRLSQHGWAYTTGPSGGRVARSVVPWLPLDLERTVAERLQLVQFHAAYRGEWLLKCILDHIVADMNVYDNKRPSWAVSGTGGNRLELDRWYVDANVAIEFQGRQHFQKGETFNRGDDEIHGQMYRDNLKAAICMRNGIHLIEFMAADLTYPAVRQKVEGHLPVVSVREEGPVYTAIENMCRSYMNFAAN